MSFRQAFNATAFRLQGKTFTEKRPLSTNFRFLLRMTLLVASIPFRLKRTPNAIAIQYNDKGTRERRLYFFQKHVPLNCTDEQVLSFDPQGPLDKLYFIELHLAKIGLLFRAAWMLWIAAFVACFRRTRVNPHWKIRFAQLLLQQLLFHKQGRPQLAFFCYEPETYLSTFVAAAMLKDYAPMIVSSNSVLFRDNRYLYHPKLNLKICSRFQEEETKTYLDLGWMKVGNVELWGLEEAIVFDRLPTTAPTWDLGIYSSAGWARTHDLWRSEDLNMLRQGGFRDNPLFLELVHILESVIDFKKKHAIKVKFYLHPHEIHLLKDHQIRPPYLDLLEQNGIPYALNGKSSIENLYEVRVGLAVSSTLLFDRMNFGLTSYYYGGTSIPDNTIDVRFMGSYAKYGFRNAEELKQFLEKEFLHI